MNDQWIIDTPEKLQALLGEPAEAIVNKVDNQLDDISRDFILHSPLALVSTVDNAGRLDVSPKGDAPGFCHIVDDQMLLLPDRIGNRLAFGFHNILQTGRIGLLFMMPKVRETLRINGSAEITREPEVLELLAAKGKPAVLATRIYIEECFIHCGKAMIRSNLWQPELWIDPPDISWGRQFRDKALKQGASTSEAEQQKETINAVVEQNYKDELY